MLECCQFLRVVILSGSALVCPTTGMLDLWLLVCYSIYLTMLLWNWVVLNISCTTSFASAREKVTKRARSNISGELNSGKHLSAGWFIYYKGNHVTPDSESLDANNGRDYTHEKSLTGPRILHHLRSYVPINGLGSIIFQDCLLQKNMLRCTL